MTTNATCCYALVSGGFAVVQPNSELSINAVEGFPLEDFSTDVCNLISVFTYSLPNCTDRGLLDAGCQVPDRFGPEGCRW